MKEHTLLSLGIFCAIGASLGVWPLLESTLARMDRAAALQEEALVDLPAWRSAHEERECAIAGELFPDASDAPSATGAAVLAGDMVAQIRR